MTVDEAPSLTTEEELEGPRADGCHPVSASHFESIWAELAEPIDNGFMTESGERPSASGSQPSSTYPMVDAGTTALRSLSFDERYAGARELGAGGMGQLLVTKDVQIGRDIALKRMLPARGDRARFIREARIQGQLEHPAIVPVYDVGVDELGEAWFTMKQIKGVTLSDVCSQLRAGDAATHAAYSRRRLLTAFTSVCLAVDFAHTRGVIHRDLKPANIMLGDFGEVYVLDWGIAKLRGAHGDVNERVARELDAARTPTTAGLDADPDANGQTVASSATLPAELGRRAESGGSEDRTEIGDVIGTIGYMPPEQLRGEIEKIGPATDVWALGAILFELLAFERLVPRQSLAEALACHDVPPDPRPSARTPAAQIPPELDAICMRALAPEPAERYPSARALSDAIEQFLDGDRDAALRRQLALSHVTRAQQEATRATADEPAALEARQRALREVGRAVALDPTLQEASDTMVHLLLTPPTRMPEEAHEELQDAEAAASRVAGTYGAAGMLAMYLFLPVYLWLGIRDWTTTGIAMVAIAVTAAAVDALGRWPHRKRVIVPLMWLSGSLLLITLSRVASPFVLPPVLGVGLAAGFVLHPAGPRWPGAVALVAVPLFAAVGLELAGVVAPTFTFQDGALVILPHMLDLPPTRTVVMLLLACVGTSAAIVIYLASIRKALRQTQEQLHLHTWHLRSLVPTAITSQLRRSQPR